MTVDLDGLFSVTPSSRPRVWWHWMNGNVNLDGLKADLDWMNSVGIGGVQIFEGGMGSPTVVEDRIQFRSEKWYEVFSEAVSYAAQKDIEVSVASSAGWSVLGAEWVEPKDAMKKFVWSETSIAGGGSRYHLNSLPNCEGRFQDSPKWGTEAKENLGRDVACFAIPKNKNFEVLKPARIHVSREFSGDAASLTDASFGSWISMSRNVSTQDEVFIEYFFDELTEVGSVQIGIAGPTGFGAPELPQAYLEFSVDGTTFESLGEFVMSHSMGQMGEVSGRTISFGAVNATAVRLRLVGKPIGESVPNMMPGVRPLPFKPKDFDKFMISEFALHRGGKVHAAEFKAGFGIAPEYFGLASGSNNHEVIQSSELVDVSEFLAPDGSLEWQAPPGEWQIIRLGFSLTGHQNGPAPEEATGLEVDKLDPKKIQKYLDSYFVPLFSELSKRGLNESVIGGILSDSIESRAQNFSEVIFEQFEKRRGYSMYKWLPSIAGWVIDSADQTDKFLYDFRLTISDLVSDCMYRLIKEFSHSKNGRYYSEALESHRPQLGDDLEMRSHADVPMGAMWTWLEGELPQQTYLADLKGASSVTHVYGKSHTGCESFSTFGKPFVWSPQELKCVADLELALGVTLFNIHSSPHQPSGVNRPGVTMAPTLGQVFTRNETWANMAKPWVSYLSKTSHALNQGQPVAEILYFTGCEAPVTGIWGDSQFDVPDGYDFDFVSAEGLLSQITSLNGRLWSSQGNYTLLYLGGNSQFLTIKVLLKIKELAEAGALVAGAIPAGSPSLADSHIEFENLVQQIWDLPNVIEVDSLRAAVIKLEVTGLLHKDWAFTSNGVQLDSRLVPSADLRCIHRRVNDLEIYFVANAKASPLEVSADFTARGKHVLVLNAVDSSRIRSSSDNDSGAVIFKLSPYGSCFVLISNEPFGIDPDINVHLESTSIESWTVTVQDVSFEAGPIFNLVEHPDERVRYFSGTYFAAATVKLSEMQSRRAKVTLPGLADIAEVVINDVPAGVLWAKGQELDISAFTVVGENSLKLKMANGWRNRLIGDELDKAAFDSQPKTYLASAVFEGDANLSNAGLLCPALINY